MKNNIKAKEKIEVSVYDISSPNRRSKKWALITINGVDTDYQICKITGRVRNKNSKILLHEYISDRKYRSVVLYIDGKRNKVLVHRILAAIYIPIDKKYLKQGYSQKSLTVNHKDGNLNNGDLNNLEWCTPRENTIHAFRTGLADSSTGEKSHLSKISEKTAHKICQLISEGKNNEYIVNKLKELNVNKKTIQHIRSRECWKNVSKDYTFPKLGDSIPNTINEKTIRKICRLLEKKKYSDPEIAKKCNVKREYVKDIRTHKRRMDISKDYNF